VLTTVHLASFPQALLQLFFAYLTQYGRKLGRSLGEEPGEGGGKEEAGEEPGGSSAGLREEAGQKSLE